MLIQEQLELSGESGRSYTFDVYAKSGRLPETGGIYMVTYSHPRGHLAGLQVNILSLGATTNIESAVAGLRDKESLAKACWNYICILCLDDAAKRSAILEDLQVHENSAVHC